MSIDHSRSHLAEQVETFYEEFADAYDEVAEEACWMANDALAGELVAAHGVDSALDLACGTGQTLRVLRRVFPEAELMGVDISCRMLRLAGDRVGDARLVHSDIGSFVDTTSEQFDLITSVGGLEFVPDLPAILAGLRSLVRPLGHLIFTYEPVIEGWGPQAAREESNLGSSGLTLTTLRWEPTEVDGVFRDWQQVSHRLVMSYVREDLPTIYALVHVARVAGDVRPVLSP